jgi:hypothetical protein
MGKKRKEPTASNEEPPRSPRKEEKKKRRKDKKNRIIPSPPPLDIRKEMEKTERLKEYDQMDIDAPSTSTANQNKFAVLAPLEVVPAALASKEDRLIKSNSRIATKDKGKGKAFRMSPEFSDDLDDSVPVPKAIHDEGESLEFQKLQYLR